jgi:hypothetical protein
MQEIEVKTKDDFILVKSRKNRISRRAVGEIKPNNQIFSTQVLNYTHNLGVVPNLQIKDEKIIKYDFIYILELEIIVLKIMFLLKKSERCRDAFGKLSIVFFLH